MGVTNANKFLTTKQLVLLQVYDYDLDPSLAALQRKCILLKVTTITSQHASRHQSRALHSQDGYAHERQQHGQQASCLQQDLACPAQLQLCQTCTTKCRCTCLARVKE